MRKYLRHVFICVLLLIVAVSLYFVDGYLNSSMKHAIYVGDMEKMKLLKRMGARVNAKDDLGNTPIHLAASHGNVEAMQWLKDKGADVNAKNNLGMTAMFAAVETLQLEAMKWLKEQGLDVNAKDNHGCTPSSYALFVFHSGMPKSKKPALEWLIANGVTDEGISRTIKWLERLQAKDGTDE